MNFQARSTEVGPGLASSPGNPRVLPGRGSVTRSAWPARPSPKTAPPSHCRWSAAAHQAALRGQRQDVFPVASAFSLLEVMVAIAIFFGAAFAILQVVSGALANARLLQRPQVDAAAVASSFSTTNKIIEGTDSGNLSDLLGDTYQGYTWEYTSREVASNKLFQVDFTIYSPAAGHPVFSQISARFFRPQSPAGSLDSGLGFH